MNFDLTLSNIREKGFRVTKVRKEIIKIFAEASQPLSTKNVTELLSKSGITLNKTTVYRELQFLLLNRYITEVYIYPNDKTYEPSDLMHHHHLVCIRCGDIDNITNCLAEKLEETVQKKKGFKITRHSLEFYGTCADCSKNV